MQIRNSSDWRDALPFELPVPAAEVLPGEPTRCAGCGAEGEPWPREALWVVKHRHPNNPAGFVRYYCADHKPTPKLAPAPSLNERARRSAPRAASSQRAGSQRKPAAPTIPERVAALCPDCFVEVPPSGICGMCGQPIT
ncbi:glucose-6-phosphate dehydrogenase [Microbacterium sp. bgisy203]|uniref:glucose-6-phosphate dehydrogenase n=1 Tax=Microbacterium sp. bgisy203 TaxID=3413799 RepID=UPI003D73C60E